MPVVVAKRQLLRAGYPVYGRVVRLQSGIGRRVGDGVARGIEKAFIGKASVMTGEDPRRCCSTA
jgi:hypothetical protein